MILSLNAGGLRKRLNTPEWEETISSYNIVCIQETHFDAYDSLDILGFKCLPLITRNNAKVRSGGLAILVREHLYDSIKILKSEGDHFYWFTLINHFPQDIAFCCVYVAPEGSNYSNTDYFDSLEADILFFASHNYKFCLLGDFNAHTNNELDFTCVDDNIQQSLNIGNAIDNNLGFCPLEELGFSKERHNSDLSHQGSRSPDFGAEIRPHSQCQKVWFFPNSRQKILNLTKKIFFFFGSLSLFHRI